MKILFLTDNYPPEVNAPATRTHFHCQEWVKAGHDVTVLTCVPNFPRGEVFPGYLNRPCQTEWMDGVRVIRVWSFMAPNAGFVKRIADYLSYAFSATIAGLGEDFDVLVATSPQFFTALAGATVARVKGKPWVFELRDLWPESIVATGAMRDGFVIQALERLEMTLYRSADLIVSVTRSFRRQLAERGIPASKIRVVTNGVRAADFTDGREGPFLEGDRPFRVGYLGTHGLAHGLDLVLRTAVLFDPKDVEFILVGDGADKPRLVDAAGTSGLSNVHFRDPIPRERIPETLSGFDACLVPLRDSDTFRSVIPSKIFEAAAARRPVLLGVRGESRELVEEYGAGIPFAPEREEDLAEAIRQLRGDRRLYAELQEGGSRLAAAYDRRTLAATLLEHLETLA